jgi:N-methylhydantoinase A
VICPPSAGVASALGLLVAPARVDRVATVGVRLDQGRLAELEAAFRRLEDEARAVIADTGLPLAGATVQRLADGRFLGQGFDLVVALPPGPFEETIATRAKLGSAFESAYREKFALTPPTFRWSSSISAWRSARQSRAATWCSACGAPDGPATR